MLPDQVSQKSIRSIFLAGRRGHRPTSGPRWCGCGYVPPPVPPLRLAGQIFEAGSFFYRRASSRVSTATNVGVSQRPSRPDKNARAELLRASHRFASRLVLTVATTRAGWPVLNFEGLKIRRARFRLHFASVAATWDSLPIIEYFIFFSVLFSLPSSPGRGQTFLL